MSPFFQRPDVQGWAVMGKVFGLILLAAFCAGIFGALVAYRLTHSTLLALVVASAPGAFVSGLRLRLGEASAETVERRER